MSDSVSGIEVSDLTCNFSNHCPIFLECCIACDRFVEKVVPSNAMRSQVSWHKVTPEMLSDYKCKLNDLLAHYNFDSEMLYCNDVHCQNEKHKTAIDNLCKFIISSCIDASTLSLPVTQSVDKSHDMPFWREECQPLRELAINWHNMWKDQGKPHVGRS